MKKDSIVVVGAGANLSTTIALNKHLEENRTALLIISEEKPDVFDTRPTFVITNPRPLEMARSKKLYLKPNSEKEPKIRKQNNRKKVKRKKKNK